MSKEKASFIHGAWSRGRCAGSCTNMALTSMVEKLNLQATTHSHPYNVQCLNQGKGLQVNSRCLICLSIGKSYHEELWCDIIPKDTCHILLGEPRLFDGRVSHDGYLSTYSLTKDGRKITLAPLSPLNSQNRNHKRTTLKPSCSLP